MAKKEAEVHGIRIKETRADRTFNVLNLIFWMIVLFITLYPLWLVLIASVSDPDAVLAGEVLFWPKGFSLMGYEAVFQHSELWQSYLNSIIYTVLGSALSVIVSLAAAYALSRKFAGKAFVNFLITFTMFFSGGLIPIFLNVRDLGLYDTRLVMILMNTVSVWNLMVARTYIQSSIPNELYEAAVMDGADHFTYFFRCVLPLSGTIIAVLSVYYGVARWNDYFTGLVFIRTARICRCRRCFAKFLLRCPFPAPAIRSSPPTPTTSAACRKPCARRKSPSTAASWCLRFPRLCCTSSCRSISSRAL